MLRRKDPHALIGDPAGMMPIDVLDVMVADVLAARPAAARVFIERGMGCVGCTFAPFETVAEAARIYGLDPVELARDLSPGDDEHPEARRP